MSAGHDVDAESLLRSLMDNVPGAIYRCGMDESWRMRRVSDEIEHITGYPASDFIDGAVRTLVSVTHPRDRDRVDREIAQAIDAHRPFALEYRINHADGGLRWVLERGVKTVDRDGIEWLDAIIFDVTKRHEAEEHRLQRETEAARVEELEASRVRIIGAADAARRRIERDLHDGAQQRLVVASLHLRTAELALARGRDPTESLRTARTELDAGLKELRELARGIHPAVLTDRGLIAAVQALTARSAVAVEVHDGLGERLEPDIESALYFTVAEALTNVDRYAAASHASVHIRRDGDRVEVEVDDDGRGGADRSRGSGLRGLEDRLGAVNGVLELESPPNGGTRVRACVRLPPHA